VSLWFKKNPFLAKYPEVGIYGIGLKKRMGR